MKKNVLNDSKIALNKIRKKDDNMKYCKMCDEEFPDNLMFCPKCNSFLDNQSPNQSFDGNTIIDKNENEKFDINKAGVYKIVNKRTGEVFVSHSKNMKKGIEEHQFNLRTNKHHNKLIQNDYNSGDRFNFIILEEFDKITEYQLDLRTMHWIREEDSYYFGYNQTPGGHYHPDQLILMSKGRRLKEKED